MERCWRGIHIRPAHFIGSFRVLCYSITHMKAPNLPAELLEREEWRPVLEFSGLYEVSNMGRVRSLPKETQFGSNIKVWPSSLISVHTANSGYDCVVFSIKKRQRTRFIHRLVALAFLAVDADLPYVNHKNGNKRDNRAENLEWVTAKDNSRHALDMGLMPRGSKSYLAHLTEDDIPKILKLRSDGLSYKEIGCVFKVGWGTIRSIFTGRTWRHVTAHLGIESFRHPSLRGRMKTSTSRALSDTALPHSA